jgi:hypothetical protein
LGSVALPWLGRSQPAALEHRQQVRRLWATIHNRNDT